MQNEKTTLKTILIIEDEKPTRRILKDKLKSKKFNILEAQNGEEGLRISLEKHPDLILLDIVMPIMDGMTMLRRLRKDKWGKKAQVILLTNLSDTEKIKDSTQQNVSDYLIKTNWKINDLIKKIKSKLN